MAALNLNPQLGLQPSTHLQGHRHPPPGAQELGQWLGIKKGLRGPKGWWPGVAWLVGFLVDLESGPSPAQPCQSGPCQGKPNEWKEVERGPVFTQPQSQRNIFILLVTHSSLAENFVFSFKITDFHLQTIMCSQEVTCIVSLCKLLLAVFVFLLWALWAMLPSGQADS